MRVNIVLTATLFIVLLAVGAVFTISQLFAGNRVLKEAYGDSGVVVLRGHAFSVDIARTVAARMKGLSGSDPLEDSQGMLFVFKSPGMHGFWMQGMRFPLDIVWIAGDRVVGASENLTPETGKNPLLYKSYYPPAPVDKVLEINAGLVAKYGIIAGDRIEFTQQAPISPTE